LVSILNPEEFRSEYYRLTVIAKARGLSAAHLRKSQIEKFRFGNANYLRTADVNTYLEYGDA